MSPHTTERGRLWISGMATVGIACIVGLIYMGYGLRRLDQQRRHSDAQNAALIQRARTLASALAEKGRLAEIVTCNRSVALRRALNDTTATQLRFLESSLVARQRAAVAARKLLASGITGPIATKARSDYKANADAVAVYRVLIKHEHLVPIPNCASLYPPIKARDRP